MVQIVRLRWFSVTGITAYFTRAGEGGYSEGWLSQNVRSCGWTASAKPLCLLQL